MKLPRVRDRRYLHGKYTIRRIQSRIEYNNNMQYKPAPIRLVTILTQMQLLLFNNKKKITLRLTRIIVHLLIWQSFQCSI